MSLNVHLLTFDLQTLFKTIGIIVRTMHRLDRMTKDQKSSHVDMFRKLVFHLKNISHNLIKLIDFD